MLSRFDTVPERDGQTDRQNSYIRIVVLTRDKNAADNKSNLMQLLRGEDFRSFAHR